MMKTSQHRKHTLEVGTSTKARNQGGCSVSTVGAMDGLTGRTLTKVTRLAWTSPGELPQLNVGPVHLLFNDGQGCGIASNCDWTLGWAFTRHEDDSHWLTTYDYDFDGARWASRDASAEQPFINVIGKALDAWKPLFNEVNEVVGLDLTFGGTHVTLRTWEGELTT